MSRDFILLEALKTFSVDEAVPWLGRIVRFYQNPISAYTPTEGRILLEQPHEDNHYTNVRMVASKLSSSKVRADFLGLFGITLDANHAQSRESESHSVQRLRIHNEDVVLEQLLQNPDVIARLGKWGFGVMKPTFMVVGLLIADGISYNEKHESGGGIGMNVDAGQIASAAFGVPTLSATPISGEVQRGAKESVSMIAKGRRVFAVEYRVFQRKIASNPWGQISVENTKLRAHGPIGDRAFDLEQHLKQPTETVSPDFAFTEESLDEFVEEDDAEEKCFSFDD